MWLIKMFNEASFWIKIVGHMSLWIKQRWMQRISFFWWVLICFIGHDIFGWMFWDWWAYRGKSIYLIGVILAPVLELFFNFDEMFLQNNINSKLYSVRKIHRGCEHAFVPKKKELKVFSIPKHSITYISFSQKWNQKLSPFGGLVVHMQNSPQNIGRMGYVCYLLSPKGLNFWFQFWVKLMPLML